MAKVYVGVISRNTGHWPMFLNLLHNLSTIAQKANHFCYIDPLVGDSLVSRARNELQTKFLRSDADYYLQIDDDISIPEDAIIKLIEADKDIVGGAYRLKMPKVSKCALRSFAPFDIKDHPNELIKIQYLSTGCFMQKRHVCEEMIAHYPELRYIANGKPAGENIRYALYMPYLYEDEYLSEDWAYCQRALDKGYDIWLHTGVLCGHWGLKNYSFDDDEIVE